MNDQPALTTDQRTRKKRVYAKSTPSQPRIKKPKPLQWHEMATQLRRMRTDLGRLVWRKPTTPSAEQDLLFRQDVHAAMTFLECAWQAAEELRKGSFGYDAYTDAGDLTDRKEIEESSQPAMDLLR